MALSMMGIVWAFQPEATDEAVGKAPLWPYWAAAVVPFLINIPAYAIAKRSLKAQTTYFFKFYFTSLALKSLLSIGFVVGIVLSLPVDKVTLALVYFAGYFLALVFEVRTLLSNLRHLSKTAASSSSGGNSSASASSSEQA